MGSKNSTWARCDDIVWFPYKHGQRTKSTNKEERTSRSNEQHPREISAELTFHKSNFIEEKIIFQQMNYKYRFMY